MRTLFAAFVFALLACGCASSPGTMPTANDTAAHLTRFPLTRFNAPASVFPGVTSTEPTGITALYITATVSNTSGATAGGLYDRTNMQWAAINYPGAQSTAAYGPKAIAHGYLIAGSYKDLGQNGDDGFVYDSTTGKYTSIAAPANACAPQACNFTIAHSVDGRSAQYLVVGNYDASTKAPTVAGHAFLYNSATQVFENIDIKHAVSTTAYGIWIDGKSVAVAGGYTDKKGRHAYVRDLTSGKLITYDYPKAALTHFEGITGDGGPGYYNLAGDYTMLHDKAVYGFYLHVQDWTPWPPIVLGKLSANSVSVRDVVGVYARRRGPSGFITTVPVQDPP